MLGTDPKKLAQEMLGSKGRRISTPKMIQAPATLASRVGVQKVGIRSDMVRERERERVWLNVETEKLLTTAFLHGARTTSPTTTLPPQPTSDNPSVSSSRFLCRTFIWLHQ